MITVKVYKDSGATNIKFLKSTEADLIRVPADQLRLFQHGDNITIKDALLNTDIVWNLPYTQFQDEAGDSLGASATAVLDAIDAIIVA